MNQTQAFEILQRYIRARYPIIVILSHEEGRVISAIKSVSGSLPKHPKQVIEWSVTTGLTYKEGEVTKNWYATSQSREDQVDTRTAEVAISEMINAPVDKPLLFVMKDLHGLLDRGNGNFDPILVRFLRDLTTAFEDRRHTLVLLSPSFPIPPDLEKILITIDWPLPGAEEIEQTINLCEKDYPDDLPEFNGNRERVVQAMRGLTYYETNSVLLSGVIAGKQKNDKSVDALVKEILKEKEQIIKKSGVLEYYDTNVTMKEVGGLPYLKRYAQIKRRAFSAEAAAFGVDAPKGVLLVGIPGTGKSLAAKAIAGGQMPLLRMDIGALMGGLVGQSESNMRAALKVSEAVAPCVLWLDEIEKALGGTGGGELDGGTSARVFGTLLTWMQETTAPVYVVATANNIRSLKPELIRRFDDMFWVDLPPFHDRVEILAVHLNKRRVDCGKIDLEAISRKTRGFSGAEIEKAVKSALETAFFEGVPLTTEHLLNATARIVPIIKTMAQPIKELREQAKNALQAGDPLEDEEEETSNRPDYSEL